MHGADAQWRATAWTMDFKNDTDACIALTVGEEGAPPIDAAVVGPHRGQHFDDNHTSVIVHAKIYERADCTGRFVADLHEPVRQLRNILTVAAAGSGYAMHRQETPDAVVTSGAGAAGAAPSAASEGENFQTGPAYRVRSVALANVHLGDDARTVAAIAAAGTSHRRAGSREISFSTRDAADVTVDLRHAPAAKAGGLRASNITYTKQTPTPASAAAFARAALERYGWKPTTQVSGAFILLRYCVFARGKNAASTATCDRTAPVLEVRATVPVSTIDLRDGGGSPNR
jgi:hypothetical protein